MSPISIFFGTIISQVNPGFYWFFQPGWEMLLNLESLTTLLTSVEVKHIHSLSLAQRSLDLYLEFYLEVYLKLFKIL